MVKLEYLTREIGGDFCLLCGGKPSVIGLFVPENSEAWGGCKDKVRLFRYCLCKRCNKKSDRAERVEKVILSELAGGKISAE